MKSNGSKLCTAQPNRQKLIKGFLSLELGIVLLVVAGLIAGAVMYYRDNVRKTSINTNMSQVQKTAANLRMKYGSTNQFLQATTANAVRSSVIPAELRDGSASTASNAFGSAIVVAVDSLTGTSDAAKFNWGNVPSNQCSDIVSGTAGEFRKITVAGADVKALDSTLNLTTLETQCESAGVGGNVSLVFWVGRS